MWNYDPCSVLLLPELYRNLCARLCSLPHWQRHVALQHHVVAEKPVYRQIFVRQRTAGEKSNHHQSNCQYSFHFFYPFVIKI
jgi:hypothetical protein